MVENSVEAPRRFGTLVGARRDLAVGVSIIPGIAQGTASTARGTAGDNRAIVGDTVKDIMGSFKHDRSSRAGEIHPVMLGVGGVVVMEVVIEIYCLPLLYLEYGMIAASRGLLWLKLAWF